MKPLTLFLEPTNGPIVVKHLLRIDFALMEKELIEIRQTWRSFTLIFVYVRLKIMKWREKQTLKERIYSREFFSRTTSFSE